MTQPCPRRDLRTSLLHSVWSTLGSMDRVALRFRDSLRCSLCYMAPVLVSIQSVHAAWCPPAGDLLWGSQLTDLSRGPIWFPFATWHFQVILIEQTEEAPLSAEMLRLHRMLLAQHSRAGSIFPS